MYKLIIDLEMNSPVKLEQSDFNSLREIIEIGAVLLNDSNNEIGRFQSYIKPTLSKITNKITRITNITNEDVKDAPYLEEALDKLSNFIEKHTTIDKICLYTWSDNDTYILNKEIEYKSIENKLINHLITYYVDVQDEFNKKINFENRINLAKALELIGEDFEGVAHGALADAFNTARIYKYMQNDEKVKKLLDEINKTMACEELTTSLGNIFDFSKFNFT